MFYQCSIPFGELLKVLTFMFHVKTQSLVKGLRLYAFFWHCCQWIFSPGIAELFEQQFHRQLMSISVIVIGEEVIFSLPAPGVHGLTLVVATAAFNSLISWDTMSVFCCWNIVTLWMAFKYNVVSLSLSHLRLKHKFDVKERDKWQWERWNFLPPLRTSVLLLWTSIQQSFTDVEPQHCPTVKHKLKHTYAYA